MNPADGALVLLEGAVATTVLGRGVKKVVSWDDKTWRPLVAAGFVRILEVQALNIPEPEPVAEPAPKRRSRKASNKIADEAAEAVNDADA